MKRPKAFMHEGVLRYGMLMHAFSLLHFEDLPVLPAVCRLWRSVTEDPSWKPDLVASPGGKGAAHSRARTITH